MRPPPCPGHDAAHAGGSADNWRCRTIRNSAPPSSTRPPPTRSPTEIPVEPTQPTLFGSLTGVGADNGSRLAAGGLNNPIVYNRLGSGLSVSQMITDFGRTSNLVAIGEAAGAGAGPGDGDDARADSAGNTSRAYFAVLRAQAVLKVAQADRGCAASWLSDQVTRAGGKQTEIAHWMSASRR